MYLFLINSLLILALVFFSAPIPSNATPSDGTEDISFYNNLGTGFTGGNINKTAIQSDGKILVGGSFTSLNGNTRNRLVRLNSDGTEDATFYTNLGTGFNIGNGVHSITIQSDGKILVGGDFTDFNGNTRNRLVRLNSDGTEDVTFYTNLGTSFDDLIRAISLQSDGKIIVGGEFENFNGNTRYYLVRLNSDGTEDVTFYTNLGTGFDNYIYSVLVEPDDQILVGGFFTNLNGNTRERIVRLNSDGTEEGAFYTNLGPTMLGQGLDSFVFSIALQSDDKILLAGPFQNLNGNTRKQLIRLNSNGSEDALFYTNLGTSFSFSTFHVNVQADDDILVGGSFLTFNGNARKRLVRLTNPILLEITPVTSVIVNSTTASYTFHSNTSGTITYGGSCSSGTISANQGNNTINFENLTAGEYNNCTIQITNGVGTLSNILSVSPFTVVIHSSGGGSSTPSTEPTPTEPPTPETTEEPVVEEEPTTPEPETPIQEEVVVEEEIIPEPQEEPQTEVIQNQQQEIVEPIVPIQQPTTNQEVATTTENNSNITTTQTPIITEPTIEEQSTNQEGILSFIVNEANRTFRETTRIFNQGKENIQQILQTEEGNIISKTITTGGVAVGTGALIASSAFATPITFSEIPLIPFRMWTLFLGFLGIKKRIRRWGVVYDSQTKQPLDPAYVILKDKEGKELATTITDIDGRYGFLVNPGVYKLFVHKTNYAFPSHTLSNTKKDELYDNLYSGEDIVVNDTSEVIVKNIPLDRLNFSWNEYEKERKKLTSFSHKDFWFFKLSNILFTIGLIIALIAFIAVPESYNGIIFSLYAVVYIIKMYGISPNKKGSIIDKNTNLPLSYSIVRLYYTDIGQEVAHAVADKFGRFYCLVKNGTYTVVIEKKDENGNYSPIYKQTNVTVKDGVLNVGFRV